MLQFAQTFFVDKIVLIETEKNGEMNLENLILDIKQVSQKNVKISVLIAQSCSKEFLEKFFISVNKPLFFITTGLNSTKVIKEVKKSFQSQHSWELESCLSAINDLVPYYILFTYM